MVFVEPAFPRGKKRVSNEDKIVGTKKFKAPTKFGASITQDGKAQRLRPKERRRALLEEKKADEEDEQLAATACNLTLKMIQPGMLLLGCVRAISNTSLEVSLPGRMYGVVPVSSISNAYSNQLQEMIDTQSADCPLPSDMYAVGDLVYVKVMKKQNVTPFLILSLNPVDLHSDFKAAQVVPGLVLAASVTVSEDHGYTMETGVRNVRAFLPLENVCDNPVDVGRNLICSVETVNQVSNGAVVILKAFQPGAPWEAKVEEPEIETIVPGSRVTFTVGTPVKYGLRGMVFDDSITAYVNEHALTKVSSKMQQYTPLKTLPATLLYLMPFTKQVYVTLAQYPNNRVPSGDAYVQGTLIENAVVKSVQADGVWLQFNNNKHRALINRFNLMKNLASENYDESTVMMKFNVGTSHNITIVRYDMFDRTFIAAVSKDQIKTDMHSATDVVIGETYDCEIVKIQKDGFGVMFGTVKGFVQREFYDTTGHIARGKTLPLRAVGYFPGNTAVRFTNQPMLMDSSASILSDWDQLDSSENDQCYHGVVGNVTDEYVVVRFFNNISGLLYRKTYGLNQDESKIAKLKIGMVERFFIREHDRERKLLLLKMPSMQPLVRKSKAPVVVEKAFVTLVHPTGVDVRTAGGETGTIGLECFSEFGEHNPLHVRMLREGDTLTVVKTNPNEYSARCVEYFKQNPLYLEDVRPGNLLKASCFNLNGGLYAKLLLSDYERNISVQAHLDRKNKIEEGTTVMVRVYKLYTNDAEGATLKVSTALKSVCSNGINDVFSYMSTYLQDVDVLVEKARRRNMPFASFSIGQLVSCTIDSIVEKTNMLVVNVCEDGGDTKTSAKGIAYQVLSPKHRKVTYAVGQTVRGRVVWLDVEHQLVQVCLGDTLVDNIVPMDEFDPDDLEVDEEVHSCHLIFSNSIVRVACFKSGPPRPLVLIPIKHHSNDTISHEWSMPGIGVRLVKCLGPMIFAMHPISYNVYESLEKNYSATIKSSSLKPRSTDKLTLRSRGPVRYRELPETFDESRLNQDMEEEESSDGSDEGSDDEDEDESEASADSEDDGDFDEDYVVEDEDEEESKPNSKVRKAKNGYDFISLEVQKKGAKQANGSQTKGKKVQLPVAKKMNGNGVRKDEQKPNDASLQAALDSLLKKRYASVKEEHRQSKDDASAKAKKLKPKKKNAVSPMVTEEMDEPSDEERDQFVGLKPKKEKKSLKKKTSTGGTMKMVKQEAIEEEVTKKGKKGNKNADGPKLKGIKSKANDPVGTGKAVKKPKRAEFMIDQLDGASDWSYLEQLDGTEDMPPAKATRKRSSTGASKGLPGATNFWDTTPVYKRAVADSSDEDGASDEDESETVPKKRLTGKERFEAMKLEEERIRKIEEELANPSVDPHTPDQFDRLVLAQPNNSMLWIRYMVFHMESAELEKARAVGRKALKAINFREEAELLNVWVALLNLEIRYETVDRFKEVLQEAIQYNDAFKLYSRVLDILIDCEKHAEVRELLELLQKKFRKQNDMWFLVADAWYRIGEGTKVKPLLSQALKSLLTRDHIPLIVKFAFLHNRNGNRDEAQLLFEQILTSYPKRTDIWSQYVDMLVKDQQVENARQILERAIMQRLPLKNMKTLYTKYVNFEEKHGDRDSVRRVKKMAADYVQAQLKSAGVTKA